MPANGRAARCCLVVFSVHTHYGWINIKGGNPLPSPSPPPLPSWWRGPPCGPRSPRWRRKAYTLHVLLEQEMRLWRLYYNFGQQMRFDSYRCPKMRRRKKEKKKKCHTCRVEINSSNCHSTSAMLGQAEAGQLCATFLPGLVRPQLSPLLLPALNLWNQGPFHPSSFHFGTSGPQVILSPLPGLLFLLLLGSLFTPLTTFLREGPLLATQSQHAPCSSMPPPPSPDTALLLTFHREVYISPEIISFMNWLIHFSPFSSTRR